MDRRINGKGIVNMQIIKENMETNKALLTGYIQDISVEMPHLNTRPAVLILPGGAYHFCSDREAEPVALAYVQQGFNAFVLRYTVGIRGNMDHVFERALEDAQEALRHLRSNAVKYHIDAKQIAVVGFSTGGTLAAALGSLSEEKPNALVLGYPCFDVDFNAAIGVKVPDIMEAVDDGMPPVFLFASQGDKLVPAEGSLHLAVKLAKAKIPYELHVYAVGNHGMSLGNEVVWGTKGNVDPKAAQWLSASVDFLRNVWSGKELCQEQNAGMDYGIEMRLEQIMADVRSAALFEKFLPGLREKVGGQPMVTSLSVRKLAQYAKGLISEQALEQLNLELQKLNETKNTKREKQTAVYPGKKWLDTNGKRIQAHGGAIYYENDTYYWYGENKEKTDGKNGIWTWGIRAYSSKDLYNWQDEGLIILPETENPKSNLHPEKHVDRPHILKCDATGKYVCWIKLSGEEACFVILTADKFLGPYQVVKENYYPMGQKVGDFDLIKDQKEGKAYLFFDSDHSGISGMELSEDYLEVTREVSKQYTGLHAPFCREGVTVFQRNGKKYLLTSGMTGYIPNKSDCAKADSWTEKFESIGNPHVNDKSNASFNSQISQVFKVPGKKDLYIALADRWVPEYIMDAKRTDLIERGIAAHYEPDKYKLTEDEKKELMNSPMMESANTSISDYVWLPLKFEGDKVLIEWKEKWKAEDYE